MRMIFVLTLICMSVGFLNAQEANVDKDEQAILELLRLPKDSLSEEQIIEIAEKYMISDRHEKAYEFLKNYVPKDKTVIYDYVFAFVARKAKAENVEKLFYALLDKKEEFGAVEIDSSIFDYSKYNKYFPEIFEKIHSLRGDLWGYSGYHTNISVRRKRYIDAKINTIIKPTDLTQLHNFSIAHLGDIYRAGSETKKAEILKELNNRKIEYAELFLMMSQNGAHADNNTVLKNFALKYPENIELKILSASEDGTLSNNVDKTLLPLIAEVKDKNKKLALWLYFNCGGHLKEIKKDMMTWLDTLTAELNVPEEIKLDLYAMIFINMRDSHKIISEDLIEKYRPIVLGLLDKCIEKNLDGIYRVYSVLLLARFKTIEGSATIINKELSLIKTQNRKYADRNSLYGSGEMVGSSVGHLSRGADFPSIVHMQLPIQYYHLYNEASEYTYIDEDFRKKLVPLLENKYLKLSIHHFLKNEEEFDKIMKEIEASETFDDLQIMASYHGFKSKYKDAIATLNKALALAKTDADKKTINSKIVFYAVKTDDPTTKTDGVNAAKRLKDLELSKEESLELAMYFESLGESAEAQKLDNKVRKTNSAPNESGSRDKLNIQAIGKKLGEMLGNEKNEDVFNFLISSLNVHFAGFSGQVKSLGHVMFDWHNFNQLTKMIKNRKVSKEFKAFVSEQKSLSVNDLFAIFFILYKLDEVDEATLIAKQMIEKRPLDLTCKMLAYALNLKKNKELDDDLKQTINEDVLGTLCIIRNFWGSNGLFQASRYDLKNLLFYILDHAEDKNKNVSLYREIFIEPFLSNVRLEQYVYAESVLNERPKSTGRVDDRQKMLNDHFAFFEELMLKCMKNKTIASDAGRPLFHYYAVNKMPITIETMQAFSDAMEINGKRNQTHANLGSWKNLLPLHISLAIYFLNQNKGAELNAICEKLADDDKREYKKIIEKLNLFYAEKPITKEDVMALGSFVGVSRGESELALSVLSNFMGKVHVKNRNIHELWLASLKENFSKESNDFAVNQIMLSKYFGDQVRELSREDAVIYLLDVEKKLLPKPFDKESFERNKTNWKHYSKKLLNIFAFEGGGRFDLVLYKHMLNASQKSEFYFYITRSSDRYSSSMRDLSVDRILGLDFFSGDFSDIHILRVKENHFLIVDAIREFRGEKKEKALEKLSKMEQTDGVKLLTYWAEGKSYQEVFDLLGSKLSEFNTLLMDRKIEWAEFLAFFYKEEISQKQKLNDLGQKFKNAIDGLDNRRLEVTKKIFLEGNHGDIKDVNQFFNLFTEIYPSLLTESEEVFLKAVKSADKKVEYHEKTIERISQGDYQRRMLVNELIYIDSSNRNHLVAVTELLIQNPHSSYYCHRYSLIIKDYIKGRILDLIAKMGVEKNINGKYVLDAKQEKAFKLELNASIDDVMAINKNLVPFYMISFRSVLDFIQLQEGVFKDLIAEWGAEQKISYIKKDIYFEFKSFVEKDDNLLVNHFLSVIVNPATIPQIKLAYIDELNKRKLSEEKYKIILEQHLKVVQADLSGFVENPRQLYQLIDRYDYLTMKNSSEEFSKLIKNWYRGFEKALSERDRNEWGLKKYSFERDTNAEVHQKLIKLMKDSLEEKMVATFFNTPQLGFGLYFPAYMMFIREGFDDVVLDGLNGNIVEIQMNLNRLDNQFLSAKDLEIIKKFTEKITDSEKKDFAEVLLYRIGTQDANGNKNLDLFVRSLKEMIKKPIKDEKIKRALLKLLEGTTLSSDREVTRTLGRN